MLLPIDVLLAYTIACIALVIVPGPSVTVIIASSLRHGTRAGLLATAGTQAGLATMVAVLAFGLSTIINHMGWIFDWLRLVGAAYLIWLGIKLWRSSGGGAATSSTLAGEPGRDGSSSGHRFFWQGFLVIWSNPKALLFFGAFIPQFVDPTGPAVAQSVLLGIIFMAAAAATDVIYAIAAGRAGRWFTGRRLRILERISGSFLIGGGVWLALSKRA